MISHNTTRKEKKLWSNLGKGYSIDLCIVNDETQEAEFIGRKILSVHHKFEIPFTDFAILYRSNAQSRAFELVFRQLKIPYIVIGGQNFFDRKEIKDIIAYLNIMINLSDDISLLRIINCPKRGIGESTIIKIINRSQKLNKPVFIMLQCHLNELDIAEAQLKNINEFFNLIQKYRQKFSEEYNYSGLLQQLIQEIRYKKELEGLYHQDDQIESRWQNIEELINSIGKAQQDNPGLHLSEFIDSISLGEEDLAFSSDHEIKEKNSVKLMTLHSAKGMEFQFVFMSGMEEKLFPHERAISDGSLEEERRLCYVGITRAKQHLFMLCARQRYRNGRYELTKPSRFIEEIPKNLLHRRIIDESV